METLAGRIVLSVGFFAHSGDGPLSETEKAALDELHLEKIKLADEVLFLNVAGYIGQSTMRELAFTVYSGKRIRFLNETHGNAFMEAEAHSLGQTVAGFFGERGGRR